MKKIVGLLFGSILAVSFLSGCNSSNEDSNTQTSSTKSSTSEDKRYEIYLLAVQAGYDGTYEQWLESIKGAKGDAGPQGEQGPKGEKGADGTSLRYGDGAPNNDLGNNGDSYIDFLTWDVYVKENGEWILRGNIKTATYHTVTFDTNGGSPIASQQVRHGEKVAKPANPVLTGYDFTYWTLGDEQWSFIGYVVTEDITLTANYSLIRYDVEFLDDRNNSIFTTSKIGYFDDFEATYPYVYYPVCSQAAPSGKFYDFDKWNMDRNEDTRVITFTPSYVLKDLSYGDFVRIDDEMYPITRDFARTFYSGYITLNDLEPNEVLQIYLNGVKINLDTARIVDRTRIRPLDNSLKVLYPLDSITLSFEDSAGYLNIVIQDVESSRPEPVPGYEWHYAFGLEDWLFEDDYEVMLIACDENTLEYSKIDPNNRFVKIPLGLESPYFEFVRVFKGTTMPSYDIWKDLAGKATHYNTFVYSEDFLWKVDDNNWISVISIPSTVEEVYEIGMALPLHTNSDEMYRFNGYVYSVEENCFMVSSKKHSEVTSSDKLIKVPLYEFSQRYGVDTKLQFISYLYKNTSTSFIPEKDVDGVVYSVPSIVVLEESSSASFSGFGLYFDDGRTVTALGDTGSNVKYLRSFELDAGERFKLYDFNTTAKWSIPLDRVIVHQAYYRKNLNPDLIFEIDDEGYFKVKSSFICGFNIYLSNGNDSIQLSIW